jgi:hypothetical protein
LAIKHEQLFNKIKKKTGNMAVALPHFAEFDVHSDGAVGIRWKKWLTRFKISC